jgi:hypothetical protein
MRGIVSLSSFLLIASSAFADARWLKMNEKDELTDQTQDIVIVWSDEKNEKLASGFCIGFKGNEPEYIGMALGDLDRVLPEKLGSKEISVTHRAKDAPKRTGKWKLFPGNREIHLVPPTKESALEMISGDSLIIQIDHTGKRYKFDMSGPEGDKLREYVRTRLNDGE